MERITKGQEIFRRMFGAEYSERFLGELQEVSPEFARIVDRFLVPEIWAMEKMDLKTKILCAFSALAALGRPEMRPFAYAAYHHGVTREQLTEIILVVGIEAGFPAAFTAFKQAGSAWRQYQGMEGSTEED